MSLGCHLVGHYDCPVYVSAVLCGRTLEVGRRDQEHLIENKVCQQVPMGRVTESEDLPRHGKSPGVHFFGNTGEHF